MSTGQFKYSQLYHKIPKGTVLRLIPLTVERRGCFNIYYVLGLNTQMNRPREEQKKSLEEEQ